MVFAARKQFTIEGYQLSLENVLSATKDVWIALDLQPLSVHPAHNSVRLGLALTRVPTARR